MFSLTDKTLYVAELDLWIDSMKSRNRSYVSHGHSDHARVHERVITSMNNARVCRLRFGLRTERKRERLVSAGGAALIPEDRACEFEEHAFNEPWRLGAHELTLFSAGHVLGSAQLLIEGERGRFVYTGDFKLERSYTAEAPEVKRCDVVLMECTYGRPQFVFPPRAEIAGQMVAWARKALEDDVAPIFFAYSLGKAQEALAILGAAGLPLTTHGAIHSMARVYDEAGVAMPPHDKYDANVYDGTSVLLWPPSGRALPKAVRHRKVRTASLTGWTLGRTPSADGSRPAGGGRFGVDAGFPLSDHADFPSLLKYIELAQPRKVLLNHGYKDFTHRLRRMGIDAEFLEANPQLALF